MFSFSGKNALVSRKRKLQIIPFTIEDCWWIWPSIISSRFQIVKSWMKIPCLFMFWEYILNGSMSNLLTRGLPLGLIIWDQLRWSSNLPYHYQFIPGRNRMLLKICCNTFLYGLDLSCCFGTRFFETYLPHVAIWKRKNKSRKTP